MTIIKDLWIGLGVILTLMIIMFLYSLSFMPRDMVMGITCGVIIGHTVTLLVLIATGAISVVANPDHVNIDPAKAK